MRHGTVSIIAALNVHTGQVLTERTDRNNADTFIGFLRQLNESIPPAPASTWSWTTAHPTSRRRRRPGRPLVPRFNIHRTREHANWLDQVELFFSALTRRLGSVRWVL
ncbi:hypothetical protein CTZ27_28275 [Streptomyces griseocarneus]|nr:hypothetical protein CTZ27_28275 [Streptomyces griseocarneus]